MASRVTHRNRAVGVIAVLGLIAGLAACGGTDDGDAGPVTDAPTTVPVTGSPGTTPAATEAPAPTTEIPSTDTPTATEPEPDGADELELVWRVDTEGRPDTLAVHPDGERVVVGVGAVYVMQLADGELLDVIVYPTAPGSLAVAPDGMVLAAGLALHGAGVTDLAGDPVPGLEGLRTVGDSTAGVIGEAGQYDTYVSFSPDGAELVTGDRSGALQRWGVADGGLMGAFVESGDAVVAVEHDPTGSLVAVTRVGCEVEVWERDTSTLRHELELSSGDGSCGLASTLATFAPDGASMIVATRDADQNSVARMLDVTDASVLAEFEVLDRVRAVDVSPDGELLVVASRLGTTIRDLPGGELRYEFDETFDATATQQPLTARFTPDGGHVALTRGDGAIELWRLPGAEVLVAPERQPCDPLPIPGDVLFDTASATLRPSADDVLAGLAAELADGFPVATLTFVGHTDSRGSDATNQPLSQERAGAVEAWFTAWASANGITGWTTGVEGRGASELEVPDTDADGGFLAEAGALNRRVEITIDAEGCAN